MNSSLRTVRVVARSVIKTIYQFWIRIAGGKRFLSCLREYFDFVIIDQTLAESTQRKYDVYYENIERFLRSKHLEDVRVRQLRIALFEELRMWLHKDLKSCGKSHSSRHLEKCIAAMDYAVRREWIRYNPIAALLTGRDRKKEIVY